MNAGPLAGRTVLVTRPEAQADELVAAIEAAGGTAWRFPVMALEPRDRNAFAADLADIGSSDIVIFVSANAVRHGLAAVGAAVAEGDPPVTGAAAPKVAAIGPATAEALRAAGVEADIRPDGGFRSEHLLMHDAFEDVAGLRITIVRGEQGRELLAETLRHRGADVRHLSAYSAAPRTASADEIEALADALMSGAIAATTIMSVASYDHLQDQLPDAALDRLAGTRLVAPGSRVIQTLAERLPGAHCIEAPGPGAEAMIGALVASYEDSPDYA